jgi:hypothetical protein
MRDFIACIAPVLAMDGALVAQDQNTMTASRTDSGNRAEWHQIGDGLADLPIVQTGGSTMKVMQRKSEVAFAPPPGI